MTAKPLQSDRLPNPLRPVELKTLGNTILQSLAFGLLLIPLVIVVLIALTLIEWWRYDNWSTRWMWERGGFPCLGLFSIASTGFFLHKTIPCRFATGLAITGFGTIASYVIGDILMITPQMYKSSEIHWQRPEFLASILAPPWIIAFALVGFRKISDRINRSEKNESADITNG